MVAPAPPLLSTTMGCPRAAPSLSAMKRPMASELPPAGYGTMTRIGLFGHGDWAEACGAASSARAAASGSNRDRRGKDIVGAFRSAASAARVHGGALLAEGRHAFLDVVALAHHVELAQGFGHGLGRALGQHMLVDEALDGGEHQRRRLRQR